MRKMHGPGHLYAVVMDLELRHLRCLVAIVDSGTFTDAAIDLGISQAAVSRNLIALERILGVRLMRRTSWNITMTTAGVHVLAQARQVLAAADDLVAGAAAGHARLRIGHAWEAMGRHTREFQRRWAAAYPAVELHLIRTNSATGGLAEGLCDIAVLRISAEGNRFASAVVGHERRYCALAADDPWAQGAPSGSTRYRSGRCSSTGAAGPPRRTCGRPARGHRPARRSTSMTGCRSSPPAAVSGSPPRAPRPSTGATASSSVRYATPRPSPCG